MAGSIAFDFNIDNTLGLALDTESTLNFSLNLVVTSVDPPTGNQGQVLNISVIGNHFLDGAVVSFSGTGVTVLTGTTIYLNANTIICAIFIDAAATAGLRDVTVTNPDLLSGIGIAVFTVITAVANAPTVTSVLPSAVFVTDTTDITITGTYFQPGATVTFSNTGITVNGLVTWVSSTSLVANITVSNTAPLGLRSITVVNPDLQQGTGIDLLSVNNKPPEITSCIPSVGKQTQIMSVQIQGAFFQTGAIVAFSGLGITVTATHFIAFNQLIADIEIAFDAIVSIRDVTVTNLDTQTGTGIGLFSVVFITVALISIMPITGCRGETLNVEIKGKDFQDCPSVSFSGTGITVNLITYVNNETLQLEIFISSSATLGLRDVVVTNPNGDTDIGQDFFTVKDVAPNIISVVPNEGNQGQTLIVVINGNTFQPGILVAFSGTGILIETITVESSIKIILSIVIDNNAPVSVRDIFLTNPGDTLVICPSLFTVKGLPPIVTTVMPIAGEQGSNLNVTIIGSKFQANATCLFSGLGISVISTTFISSTELIAAISIDLTAALGLRNITVVNPDTQQGIGLNLFTVEECSPVIASVTPDIGQRGETLLLTIIGNYFSEATVLFSGTGILVLETTNVSATEIQIKVNIAQTADLTIRDVTVINSDNKSVTGIGLFTVTVGLPIITQLSPSAGAQNSLIALVINGSNFQTGATVTFSGTGITVGAITDLTFSQIALFIEISSTAALTARTVTVTNLDGAFGTGVFQIVSADVVISVVTPNIGEKSQTFDIRIFGHNFQANATVAFSGLGILVNGSVTFISSEELIANITIAADATLGLRDVTVTNPDASQGTAISIFEIISSKIQSVIPSVGEQGQILDIVITGLGADFPVGCSIIFTGTGITVNSTILNNSNKLQLLSNITIASNAPKTLRSLTVTYPSGLTYTGANCFTVEAPKPVISDVSPSVVRQGNTVDLIITGQYFQPGLAIVIAGEGITHNLITYIDSTQVVINIAIDITAVAVTRGLILTNPDSKSAASLLDIGYALPIITNIEPADGLQGATFNVRIKGFYFQLGVIATFSGSNIIVNWLIFESASSLLVNVSIDSIAIIGLRSVTVINPDTGSIIGLDLFEVKAASPVIDTVSPIEGERGCTVIVTLTGIGFEAAMSAEFSGTGVIVISLTSINSTQVELEVAISPSAELTTRDLIITRIDLATASRNYVFTVVEYLARAELVLLPVSKLISNTVMPGLLYASNSLNWQVYKAEYYIKTDTGNWQEATHKGNLIDLFNIQGSISGETLSYFWEASKDLTGYKGTVIFSLSLIEQGQKEIVGVFNIDNLLLSDIDEQIFP